MKYDSSERENPQGEVTFEQIYLTYYNCLFRIALSVLRDSTLAEDAVHNAFIKIWKSAPVEQDFGNSDYQKKAFYHYQKLQHRFAEKENQAKRITGIQYTVF